MVLAFEEKDRAIIESKGMTIIEFKRSMYLYKISLYTNKAYLALKKLLLI